MARNPKDHDVDGSSGAGGLFEPVTAADFAAVDVNALTADIRRLDRRALLERLSAEKARAHEAGGQAHQHVLGVLTTLAGLHMRVEAEGDPFGVRSNDAERRTALPFDLTPALAELLATIAPTIAHPTLRARIADVAYDAGVMRAGHIAIAAYCDVADRYVDGRAEREFPDIGTSSMDLVKPLERCFMINARIAKRGSFVAPLAATVTTAFAHSEQERAYFPFTQLGRRMLQTKAMPAEDIADRAQRLAESAGPGDYDLAVKECWLLAADAHQRAGDMDASNAAGIAAIERTLAMAETVPQSSAKAHWVKAAIREYRARGDSKARVDELRRRLREYQDASLDEYSAFEVPLEGIPELRAEAAETFGGLDLPTALRAIVRFVVPEDVDTIRKVTLEQARDSILHNLAESSYNDEQGREVARGEALDMDGDPPESWFKEQGIRTLEPFRRLRVHGQIEPARRAVVERHSINEQHMLPLTHLSSFVPAGHEHIFALGFARLWQGDYVSAGHFLLPQVENSLRYILQTAGRDVSKIEEDGLEGDRPLNVLLSYCRADIELMVGRDMVWELDALLNFRPGPALRHELAHGKMGWNAFYSDAAITACWLVYLLTIAPLLRHWDSHVEPALAAMTSARQL